MPGFDEPQRKPQREEKPNLVAYWTVAALVGIVLAISIKVLAVKTYIVTTDNMKNTIHRGDMILVEHLGKAKVAERGEVLCFRYPAESSQYRLGRAVARGGDIIEIVNKDLYVNGRMVVSRRDVVFLDPLIKEDPFSLRDNFGPFEVPANNYFILGDNRDHSIDSRSYGPLRYDYVLGKPLFVYFSWKPDSRAPKLNSIIDLPEVLIYNIMNIFDRLGLDRIGTPIR